MTQIIFPVVGAYLFYKLGTNLMQKAGITPDKNETKGENAQIKLNEEKLWSPEFYQTAAKKVAPKKITVHTYASDSALAEKMLTIFSISPILRAIFIASSMSFKAPGSFLRILIMARTFNGITVFPGGALFCFKT